jgi:hypothetical protein
MAAEGIGGKEEDVSRIVIPGFGKSAKAILHSSLLQQTWSIVILTISERMFQTLI